MEQRTVFLNVPKGKAIDVEFDDIVYTVPSGRKGKKQILKGVSGKFKSGELTAIMGPSGAGKTTLLNLLTGFSSGGMKGVIRSRCGLQVKDGASQYKRDCCYILQDDHLAPFFTVSEIMFMAAQLKLSPHISQEKKQILIDDILDTLSLLTAKETRCGSLSGGQKKRLSIALELVDNPPIMFLDEPTTGLDSSSSVQCVSMLKALAIGGRNIICTIHQPSATIFEMFDHVYVLASGKCIYQGASTNTVSFLASAGLICPQYHNPADYLLEVANGEYGDFTDLLAKAVQEKCWRSVTHEKAIDQYTITDKSSATSESSWSVSLEPPSEWRKFLVLLNRSWLQIYRDWTISHLKLTMHIFVGIFLGFTFLHSGSEASLAVANIGFLLASIVYCSYTSLMPAVLKFPSELAILKKERFNNWYKLKTYYAAFLVADIPMQILFAVAYSTFSYVISEQPRDWHRYFMFVTILILATLTSSSMGLVFGTTLNPINGTFLSAITTAVMLAVAGLFIFYTHMSYAMYLLTYVSYLSFALEGLMAAIYGYGRGPIPCADEIYCHFRSPDTLMKEIGMAKDNYWTDVIYLCGSFLLFRTLAFCTLKRRLSSH